MDRNYCLLVFIVNMSFSDTESWKMLFTWKTIDVQEKGGRVLSTNTCAHNILYYSHKIGILFPQHIILFPPHIIYLLSICYLSKVHDLGQAHKFVAGLNTSCESSCLYLCKHHTTDMRQIQNKRRPESRMYWAFMCVCVCVRERERVAFSVWLLYYVPYMFMFVLPLVMVMGGLRSHNTCSTPPHIRVDVPKSGASSTLSESQLQFWTTAVILY